MSEMMHYTGKLQLVENNLNETLEEQCKRILEEHNYHELERYSNSWSEMLYDKLYEQYIIANEKLYKVIENNYIDIDENIFIAHENTDKTIDYEVVYYNSGCSFSDAVKEALENMK